MEVITLNYVSLSGYKKILPWDPKYIIKISSVMPFTFNVVELYVVTINKKLWTWARQVCRAVNYEKQPDELSGTTVPEKMFSININCRSHPPWVRSLIGPGFHKN